MDAAPHHLRRHLDRHLPREAAGDATVGQRLDHHEHERGTGTDTAGHGVHVLLLELQDAARGGRRPHCLGHVGVRGVGAARDTVIPRPMAQGVLGMARMMGTLPPERLRHGVRRHPRRDRDHEGPSLQRARLPQVAADAEHVHGLEAEHPQVGVAGGDVVGAGPDSPLPRHGIGSGDAWWRLGGAGGGVMQRRWWPCPACGGGGWLLVLEAVLRHG